MNFENFLRMPKNAKTTARLPFQHRNFGRENRRRHGLRMPADVRVLCFTAPAHTPLTTQLVFWEGEAFPEPPAFWFVLVCAGPPGKKKSLQAELWVNPGPRGGVDPRQRARAQMPVSLVYWEDAATGTSARSGQGRERIEEDARVRAYAAYGLDGAE